MTLDLDGALLDPQALIREALRSRRLGAAILKGLRHLRHLHR